MLRVECARADIAAARWQGHSYWLLLSIRAQLLAVRLEVANHLGDVIAAELLARGLGQRERDHRLADDSGCRDGGHVRALEGRALLLLGVNVHGRERAPERRDGLEEAAHAQLLAVRDAAFEAARAVRRSHEGARLRVVADLVVHLRAGKPRGLDARADGDGLDRRDGHQRAREPPVELRVPGGVRAEAGDDSARDDLEDAAERVALAPLLVNERDHPVLRFGVGAVQRRFVGDGRDALPLNFERSVGDAAELYDVAANLDAEDREQLLCKCAAGDARGGLARRRALKYVAQVARAVLESTREVCVAWARTLQATRLPFLDFFNFARLDRHHLSPVRPVLILDEQRDGRAEREAVADAAQDFGAVALDLHAPAAPVAPLPALKLAVDLLRVNGETRRQTLDDGDERATVRLTGCVEAEHQSTLKSSRQKNILNSVSRRPGV